MIPKTIKYTKEHEWIKIKGNIGILGITDYAQKELGDITYIEFPDIGKVVNKNDELNVIESVKVANDIFAPVSGKVIEINDALESSPEKINQDPYEDGWICKIEMNNKQELDELMSSDAYEEFLKGL